MIEAARRIAIVVAVAGVIFCVIALSGAARNPRIGIFSDTLPDGSQRIVSVVDGMPAQLAGIRAGDIVRYASPADRDRAVAAGGGKPIRLVRNGTQSLALTPVIPPLELGAAAFLIDAILMGSIALVIAWRAWRESQARWLALGFLWPCYLAAAPYIEHPQLLAHAAGLSGDVLTPFGSAALVVFATGWDATQSWVRRSFRSAAFPIAAANCLIQITNDLAGGRFDKVATVAGISGWLLLAMLTIAGLALSFRRTRGAERRRVGWIGLSIAVAFIPWVLYESVALVAPIPVWPWVEFTSFALPIGFGYAMLRHRVVDLGFALNRAAVFAATTLLLAGLFGGIQWAVNQVLADATRREGFIAQLIVAVVVLYIVRIARSRTESLIAHVFFAVRRRRIDAIVELATAIDGVDDPATLAPFVERALRENAQLTATLTFGDIPPDAGGAFVFPLRIRGRDRGALVCMLPPGEDFAPDEASALRNLATAAAIVRDDLLAGVLREENHRLRERVVQLGGEPALVRPGSAGATSRASAE